MQTVNEKEKTFKLLDLHDALQLKVLPGILFQVNIAPPAPPLVCDWRLNGATTTFSDSKKYEGVHRVF